MSDLRKNTEGTFSTKMSLLSKTTTMIDDVWYQWVLNNTKELYIYFTIIITIYLK